MKPDHQVALARHRGQHVDVVFRESRGAESRRHGFRRASVVAGGIGGIDFDELLKDLAGDGLVGRLGAEGENGENGSEEAHRDIMPLAPNADYSGAGAGGGGSGGDTGGPGAISFGRLPGDIRIQGQEFELLLSADDVPDFERRGVAGDVAAAAMTGQSGLRVPLPGLRLLKLHGLTTSRRDKYVPL